jgi:hypothetical protein
MGGDGIAGQSGLSIWITYRRRKQCNVRTAGTSTRGSGSAVANSIPRNVFPVSRMWWARIGVPKTYRDTKKDCGKPAYPND